MAAGYRTDAASLLDFFRKRSLTDARRKDCLAVIRQLGSGVFEERKEARKDLTATGPVVIPLLREALKVDDRELVKLAEACIQDITAANPLVPLAAARLLLQAEPEESIPVLLDYLVYTASHWETDDFLRLMVATCPAPEKVHPRLSEALSDSAAARRGAAAFYPRPEGHRRSSRRRWKASR